MKRFGLVSLLSIGICFASIVYAQTKPVDMEKMNATSSPKDNDEDEAFFDFYSRFISDSTFQMSRIEFPLEGFIVDDGREIVDSILQSEWDMFKVSVYDVDKDEYTVEIREDRNSVSHRIYIPNSGVDISMKYALKDRKWYLIYYKSVFM